MRNLVCLQFLFSAVQFCNLAVQYESNVAFAAKFQKFDATKTGVMDKNISHQEDFYIAPTIGIGLSLALVSDDKTSHEISEGGG